VNVPRYEFIKGTSSKFWEIVLGGKAVTTIYGRIGSAGVSTTKLFASKGDAQVGYDKLVREKVGKGYKLVATGGAKVPVPKPTIVARKPTARPAGKVEREGPFADAFTGPVVHFVKLAPRKSGGTGAAPRATSGGRPIMAAGQAWPTCGRCHERLWFYLQFDVVPEMQLAFAAGSHLLLFNCGVCDGMAMTVPSKKLPKPWLSPDHPQTYRVILNPPAAREAVLPADHLVLEQQAQLTRGDEEVTPLIEDLDRTPRGREGFKVGGIPARIQPWSPPRCACGAPLGFVFQVPLEKDPGWRSKARRQLMFFGLDVFIYACTQQCSPYATLVIPDR
jgi:predicted DNA-binding WGR domain protein